MITVKNSLKSAFVALTMISGTVSNVQAEDVSPEMRKAAELIVGGQIKAFRQGNHEEAFGFAAPNIRQIFGNTNRFIGMVKQGYGPIYSAQRFGFGRSIANGENTMMQEVMITGPQGRDWVALYTLFKQPDGSWRIGGVQMKKANNLST